MKTLDQEIKEDIKYGIIVKFSTIARSLVYELMEHRKFFTEKEYTNLRDFSIKIEKIADRLRNIVKEEL